MKRLVYSPKTDVYVKTDSGIVDLSPYVTDVNVNRKINQVSNASVTFRNPKVIRPEDGRQHFLFTEAPFTDSYGNSSLQPVFHPMDPIVITMTRLRGKPIQVFTGYIDTSPYVSLFPGVVTIEASCTLKRLQYTFRDPGLPFVRNFLASNGWAMNESGGLVNPGQEGIQLNKYNPLGDSSIGQLLRATLEEVGGWDPSTIYIDALPENIGKLVAKLYQRMEDSNNEAAEEFMDLLHKMIGEGSYGGGGQGGAGGGNGGPLNLNLKGSGPWISGEASFYNPMSCPGFGTAVGMDGGASAVSGVSLNCDTYGFAAPESLDDWVSGIHPRGTIFEIKGPGGTTFAPMIDSCPICDSLGRVADLLPAVARDIGMTLSAGTVPCKIRPVGFVDPAKFNKEGGSKAALQKLVGTKINSQFSDSDKSNSPKDTATNGN